MANFCFNGKCKKTLMSYIEGADISIRGMSDYSKVKVVYKSIFKILNTPSEINALEEAKKILIKYLQKD